MRCTSLQSRLRALVPAVCVVVTVAGCGSQGGENVADTAKTSAAATTVDLTYLASVFLTIDTYVPFDTLSELAQHDATTDVFQARAVSVASAPPLPDDLEVEQGADPEEPGGEDGGGTESSILLLNVEVTDVIKGELDPGQAVQVVLPAVEEPDGLSQALPANTPIVVYAALSQELAAVGLSRALVPVSPQGFIVSDPDGFGIVYPLDHKVLPELPVEKALP